MDVSDCLAALLDRICRHWIVWLIVFVGLLSFIYWRQYREWHETDALIAHLRESTTKAERRADAIVDATARREVAARAQARRKTAALSADDLCDALERLLAEYRADVQ